MPTLSDIETEVAAAVGTLAGMGTRLSDDYRAAVGGLAVGYTRFALRVDQLVTNQQDSDSPKKVADVEVDVVHRLGTAADEGAYAAAKYVHQADLARAGWWRAQVASALTVYEGPEVTAITERIGNVLKYTTKVRLVVKP